MRRPLAVAAIAVVAAISGAASAAAAPPSAPALFAGVTRVNDELSLLGQSTGPFGLAPGFRISELRLTNHDGYSITVNASEQTVSLSVSKGHARLDDGHAGRSMTTTYVTHGRVTPTSIRADFAGLGRIAVRFRPNGRVIRASKKAGCHKPSGDVIADLGFFVGELRFRGEGGYTSVATRRVPGRSIHFAALLSCVLGIRSAGVRSAPSPSPPTFTTLAGLGRASFDSPAVPTHPSRGPRRTTLLADLKLPLSRIVFGARVQGEGHARFIAAEGGSEGSLGVIRSVNVLGPHAAFTFEDSLAGATVAPPAPFHGRGDLTRGLGAKSWAGSLEVSFLGAPRVALTGASFRTILAQSWQRAAASP